MPDLRGWILQQIDAAEARARACPPWPWRYEPDDEQVVAADGIQVAEVFALSGRQLRATGEFIASHGPDAVLRRCAADRRILAIHAPEPDSWTGYACRGCGTSGYYDDWDTEHTNDCETLQALASGYGLIDEQAAALDRPEKPRPEPRTVTGRFTRTTPTSAVPAALRGPNWKGTP